MNVRHLIRESIIGLFAFWGVSFLYRSFVKRKGPLVRIVVFHDVGEKAWFESAIDTLAKTTHVLTPEEFHKGVFSAERVNTLITFDDGYASWTSIALPCLESRGLRGLFFINAGLLQSANESTSDAFMRDKLCINPKEPLTWDGAREILLKSHTIGGHAYSHENLATLTGERLRNEIARDKNALEKELGVVLEDFAYPFGTHEHFNDEVREAVESVGYTRAYTAISRFVTKRDGTFFIPRMCIETGRTGKGLSRWLNGGYDLFDIMKSCVA